MVVRVVEAEEFELQLVLLQQWASPQQPVFEQPCGHEECEHANEHGHDFHVHGHVSGRVHGPV